MYRSHSCNLVEELLSFISSNILSPNRHAMTADKKLALIRGRSRTAATSKMEQFVILVNGWKPLTIITESSILDVAAVIDPLLLILYYLKHAGSLPRKANIFRVAPTIYSKFNSFTKCSNLKGIHAFIRYY